MAVFVFNPRERVDLSSLYRWCLLLAFFASSHSSNSGQFGILNHDRPSETYDIVAVTVYTVDQRAINTTLKTVGHERNIVIKLLVSNREFVLELQINSFLFAKSYIEKAIGRYDEETINIDHAMDHCYYIGKVRNFDNSFAAVSTCNGIDGYFSVDSLNYHIQPFSNDLSANHKVYITTLEFGSFKCGLDTSNYQLPFHINSKNKMKRSFLWPQDLDRKTKVVELYVVNDFSQFQAQGSNTAVATRRAKSIVNIVSSFYQTRDVYVILVGMEVWTSSDKFSVTSDSSGTLANFLTYRATSITTPNDNAQFITAVEFDNGILGEADVLTMCELGNSGAINRDISTYGPNVVASTMAHEMGHNFGLIHDTDSCTCTDSTGKCIMYPSDNTMNPSSTWSQCSIDQFSNLFQHGMDYCLYNMPATILDSSAVCGDGIVETGEQCDCGKAPASECNNTCCNVNTCQLLTGAQCAAGRCCDISHCKIQAINFACRPLQDINCDLAEYCDGTSAYCPPDTYQEDGTNCSTASVSAYCYGGNCSNHQSQCKLLWGTATNSSNDLCYSYFNIKGTTYGNCGFVWGQNVTYIPCNTNDVMCGRLQCDANGAASLAYFTDYYLIGDASVDASVGIYTCKTVIFDELNDPGLVPNGAACGAEKMCVSQKCVDVSSIYQNSCSNRCAQQQVCNNLGNCQCEAGYCPPGFISNGMSSKTGLIVGLCILFLIILPLLILASVCGYKYREEIRDKCHTLYLYCPIAKTRSAQSVSTVYQPDQPHATPQHANGESITPNRAAPSAPIKKTLPARPPMLSVHQKANKNDRQQVPPIPNVRNLPTPPQKPAKQVAEYDNMGATCLLPSAYTIEHDSATPVYISNDDINQSGSSVQQIIAQMGKHNGPVVTNSPSHRPPLMDKPTPLPKPQFMAQVSNVTFE